MRTTKKKAVPPPLPLAITPHFDFEREAFRCGHRWVAGVGEVGRGPLAGPVGVAAIILDPEDLPIAAASIVAKTMRDKLMRNLGRDYPQYGFEEHVGYATVGRRGALASTGPCPYHRRSFRLEPEAE